MTRILWKVGEEIPKTLSMSNPVYSCLVPRTLGWLSVQDEKVCILEGFTAGAYTPPSLLLASQALPRSVFEKLRETKVCTVSAATMREPSDAFTKALSNLTEFSVSDLGLTTSSPEPGYPAPIKTSPIHMYCSLQEVKPLHNDDDGLVVLYVEKFVIDGSIQSMPTEDMQQREGVVSKIDATLAKPVMSIGNGKISAMAPLKAMPRPTKVQETWTSTALTDLPAPILGEMYPRAEWSWRVHGGTCPLGYNATTALIMPRLIGWISTYSKKDRVPHLAPYSFFTDASRGEVPMVAFSAYRKDGTIPKDAMKDAMETGCFVFNMVTEDLAIPMNLSAAELPREESEFALSDLEYEAGHWVDAPVVKSSPIRFECEFVDVLEIGSFSPVIGRVVGVSIDDRVLKDGMIDTLSLLKPLTRLGFKDEYGILS